MKPRNLVPAVLLLSLTAPAATRAQLPGQNAATQSFTAPTDRLASRRSRSQSKDELSAALVEQASTYLRSAANGLQPSAELSDAWGQFYHSCDSVIRKFSHKIAPREIDHDDCAQEVWADLLKTLPEFKVDRSRGKFTSWLYTVVRSKTTNQLRRAARDRCEGIVAAAEIPAGTDNPSGQLVRKSQRQAVRAALAVLKSKSSDRSYQVLHMRHLEGRSVGDVADSLGMKPGQVWVTEHRMKRKLRTLLADVQL